MLSTKKDVEKNIGSGLGSGKDMYVSHQDHDHGESRQVWHMKMRRVLGDGCNAGPSVLARHQKTAAGLKGRDEKGLLKKRGSDVLGTVC